MDGITRVWGGGGVEREGTSKNNVKPVFGGCWYN
jgi:hypothetical protein